jgi:ABC-type glycerol-3-phosphate transport system substrate-binding protein
MMKRDNQIKQELAKGASARKSVYGDSQVAELPYALANAQSLMVGKTMTDTVPEGHQVAEIIETAIHDILTDDRSSKQALDWAAIQINRLLANKSPLGYLVSH